MSTFEHVALDHEYVVDPERLVVFYVAGQERKIYGLHSCSVADLKTAILNRATELMQCSMVDRHLLDQCEARLVTRDGCATFRYNHASYSYTPHKPNASEEQPQGENI